jgi:hypothetical protein
MCASPRSLQRYRRFSIAACGVGSLFNLIFFPLIFFSLIFRILLYFPLFYFAASVCCSLPAASIAGRGLRFTPAHAFSDIATDSASIAIAASLFHARRDWHLQTGTCGAAAGRSNSRAIGLSAPQLLARRIAVPLVGRNKIHRARLSSPRPSVRLTLHTLSRTDGRRGG